MHRSMDTDTYLLHCFSAVGVAEVDKSTESTVVSLGCMQQGLICHMKAEFRHQEIIDEQSHSFPSLACLGVEVCTLYCRMIIQIQRAHLVYAQSC